MKTLLCALRYIHSLGIIHRDVKPSNFLFSMEMRTGKLIDFGIADMERSGQNSMPSLKSLNVHHCLHPSEFVCKVRLRRPRQKVCRAGTPGFRAPEVLFCSPHQTSAVDIWSLGIVLLSLITKSHPFFTPKNDVSALAQLIPMFGTKKCRAAARAIGKNLTCSRMYPDVTVGEYCICNFGGAAQTFPKELFCLLDKLLELNPTRRITASEALGVNLLVTVC